MDVMKIASATVIVVNPGTHPEPQAIATEFAARGYKVHYFSGSQLSPTSPVFKFGKMLGPRVANPLRRRVLSSAFSEAVEVRTAGLLLEFCFQLLARRFPYAGRFFMIMRSRRVSMAAAGLARSLGGNEKIVIAQQTSGAKIFACEAASFKVLMQPIVSQGWLEKQLAREARKNPEWSFALQGLDRDRKQLADIKVEAAQADLFLAGSELVARSLREDMLGPVIAHHYGVPSSSGSAPRIRRFSSDGGPLRLVFVGQVNQRKGISYLLDAMSELRDIAVLDVVGRASAEVVTKIQKLNLQNVTIRGAVPAPEVWGVYDAHDLLVLPSLGEGFSLVVPEAMATGLPCLVSDKAGSHEVIVNGLSGFVVPTQDAGAIASRVREIATTPGLLEHLSANAAVVGRQLTWERFAREAVDALLSAYVARRAR